jgi:hypothetical protein
MPATTATTGASRPSAPDPDTEWDTLATALNRWGILHLAPGRVRQVGLPRTPQELFARLWATGTSRLHQATVFLLLTHPELAAEARAAIGGLTGTASDRAKRRYVAATALQRMARTRIAQHLGPRPLIPPAYLDDLDLPSLDEEFGCETLLILAEQEQQRYGYDAWGTYWNLLDHFLGEIRRRAWGHRAAAGGPSAAHRRFVTALGWLLRRPIRFYLVGDSVMVELGLRGSTLDIDYVADSDDPAALAELEQAVRALKEELDVNVEPASPADFLPIPRSVLDRSRFVGRYGSVDLFYYHPPSLVIVKVARGLELDLADAERLIRAGEVEWSDVEATWREIRASPTGWVRYEPDVIEARLQVLRDRLMVES